MSLPSHRRHTQCTPSTHPHPHPHPHPTPHLPKLSPNDALGPTFVLQKEFPYSASLSSPLVVRLKDVFGFGVTGRGEGISIHVQRVETVLTLDAVTDFKQQWGSLSYLDRMRNLFSLMVQGGVFSLLPTPPPPHVPVFGILVRLV
jgi:hypothetical protein